MLRIEMVTIDCRDPRALAEWWARQLGGRVLEGFEGDDYLLVAAEHGPRLGFQRVAEPTPGKNRVHLDLSVSGGRGTPMEEIRTNVAVAVERAVAAGATKVRAVDEDGEHWVVMQDPEGNEFCLH